MKTLELPRMHSLREARATYGGKFVTRYEFDKTGKIGINAQWETHEALHGEVVVLKEEGTDLVRAPSSCAGLRLRTTWDRA